MKIRGRKSTPGRYFQVANPGTGWGGTDIADPLSIIEGWDPACLARPAPADDLHHRRACRLVRAGRAPCSRSPRPCPAVQAIVDRIGENCEPSLPPCCSSAAPAAACAPA
jgi:hypothetical protein